MPIGPKMVAIGDIPSDLASSDDGEHGDDEHDKETEQGKMMEDDESGWVMSIITKMVNQFMDWYRQQQMMLDQLTQLGLEDAADYSRE
jgi:hypothetical protein